MKFSYYLGLLVVLFMVGSCKTDLDILAPYKEIPVVYSIINHTENTHYVRIQKAFLGAGDAYVFSQIPDSNYFEDLTVHFTPFKINTTGDTLLSASGELYLNDTIIVGKEQGDFFANTQKLYYTNAKLDSTFSLKIKIKNNKTNKIYTAYTDLIENVKFNTPNASPTNVIVFASQPGSYTTYTPQWNIGTKAFYTELLLRINYRVTFLKNGLQDTLTKSITWKQSPKTIEEGKSSTVSMPIAGEEFYKYLQQQLPENGDTIKRKFLGIDFVASATTREFYDYLTINQSNSSIVQDKLTYTNINGGYGLFASRKQGTQLNKQLTSASKKELTEGQYTGSLLFE